jgi:hypothetical protein
MFLGVLVADINALGAHILLFHEAIPRPHSFVLSQIDISLLVIFKTY